jgi:hypothetical protein
MNDEVETNDENVVIPERAHDQPAEGGREQADEAVDGAARPTKGGSDVPDPERAGIVDQQGAALRHMQAES